jgi:beta-N-acetylhexosaminidase
LDSHIDLPHVSADVDDLTENDFAAFAALADLPMGMTAHIVFDALDKRPATLSPVVMDHVRNNIGFDGFVMTDDLSMKALQGAPEELAKQALMAGCDAVLYCNATLAERAAVAEACGEMSAKSLLRAKAALQARRQPEPLDIAATEAELATLIGQ